MLGKNEVIALVATKDAERARGFYEGTLGLAFVAEEPWALVFDAHGTMLRIQKVQEMPPLAYTVLGWSVADMDATVRGLAERGVAFERYAYLPQDDDGVWTTPDGSKVAWFKDPDGNILSLTQFAPR